MPSFTPPVIVLRRCPMVAVDVGIFNWLPLGQRTLDKLIRLIEKALDEVGGQKITCPILVGEGLWKKTNRWELMGQELFRVIDRSGLQLCLQPTAEESVTAMIAALPSVSTTSFPVLVYQTGEKFRDEMSPRFGLLRSRQFLMNDLYSFDRTEVEAQHTYQLISDAYQRLFDRLQLPTARISADPGAIGGSQSHEFQLANTSGQDQMKVCDKCNKPWRSSCCHEAIPVERPSIELAHTFLLGDRYSSTFRAVFDGRPLQMGCYGIGVGRLVAACLDLFSPNDTMIRLPESIVPYRLAVIAPHQTAPADVQRFSVQLTEELESTPGLKGDVLLDDRCELSIGRRLVDMNKMGVCRLVVVGGATVRSFDRQPMIETLRTEPFKADLISEGNCTHAELFTKMLD